MTDEVITEEAAQGEVVSQIPDAEYAFLVVVGGDSVRVSPLPPDSGVPAPNTHDDVYNACNTVCRNIQSEQTSQRVAQAMAIAAMAAQEKQSKGIVVPQGVDTMKLKG